MMSNNSFHTMILCKLVRKTHNGSTALIVDDVTGKAVEAIHSLLLVRCDAYQSLPKYLEASAQRHECFKQAGCEFN